MSASDPAPFAERRRRLARTAIGLFSHLAVIAALAACSVTGDAADPAVRDSAGIRVIEYPEIPGDLAAWSVADTPTISIGALDGDQPYVFGRVASAAERSDGVLLVADAQALEVRAFDRQGRYLWSAGSKGEGPGELSTIDRIFVLPSDSVLVIDWFQRKALVFDPTGKYSRQFPLAAPSEESGRPNIVGVLSGGFVGWATRSGSGLTEPGRKRGMISLAMFSGDGVRTATLADLAGMERVLIVRRPGFVETGEAIWGRRTQFGVAAGSIAVSTQDRFDISRFDSAGTPDMIIRVESSPTVADEALLARFAERDLATGVHIPDTLPAMGTIQLDVERRLWVQEYVPPFEERTPVWWVFGSDGRALAVAKVPARFKIQQIAADRVVGIALDSLEVPYVQVRRIVRH